MHFMKFYVIMGFSVRSKSTSYKMHFMKFYVIMGFSARSKSTLRTLKTDFHSVEFSERTGNLLFTKENVALNLNRILCVTDVFNCVKLRPLRKF